MLSPCVQLGMLQEGAEQAQRQEAAAKAVLKAAQVGPSAVLKWRINGVNSSYGRCTASNVHLSCTAMCLVRTTQQRVVGQCCGAVHVGLAPSLQEARKRREALTAEQVSRIQNDILFPPTAEEIEERRQAEQQVK